MVPESQADIAHIEFWEETVAGIVAAFYGLPLHEVRNLPYSQHRARIYGNRVYFGEEQQPALLTEIKKALKNDDLAFFYDDHERRLLYDVLGFEALLKGTSSEEAVEG